MINKNILEETVFKIPLKCFKKHKMFSLIYVFYLLSKYILKVQLMFYFYDTLRSC